MMSRFRPGARHLTTLLGLYAFGMILHFYIQASALGFDAGAAWDWTAGQLPMFFWGSAFFFSLLCGAAALFRNVYGGSLLVGIVAALTGLAIFEKMKATGEPLFPWDLLQLKNMSEMASMAGGLFSPVVLVLTALVLAGLGWMIFKLPKLRFPLALRVALAAASITAVALFVQTAGGKYPALLDKLSYQNIFWDQKANYRYNGFVLAFASNLNQALLDEPEGYGREAVEDIAKRYGSLPDAPPSASPSEPPNIVFVMNEAFFDPTRMTKYSLAEDPVPFVHGAQQTRPAGYVLSPEFGGSTANVEFEALTGLSMSLLHDGSVPFQQNLTKQTDMPSIVSILKGRGYDALALHPYDKTFYSRNQVYPMLGFERFIGQDDMKNREWLGSRSYLSDMAAMKEAVQELEQAEGRPLFLHLVTMQNHYPYTNKAIHGGNTIEAKGVDPALQDQLETYVEGIKHTDGALRYLNESIQKLERPTLVVLWGDHLPGLPAKIYEDAGWTDERLRHETPLLLLANYELGREPLGTISPSFAGPLALRYAGMEQPAFYKLLEAVRRQLPGLGKKVTLGAGGAELDKQALTEEQQRLLDDYRMIQFDLMEGQGYAKELLFGTGA
ncbi:sulfatase-like hydrolase/transferase [Paenibacillus albicereus]|uniref:Sulfatase-like hydrolase/transferase n=1 Tax=Paenibacillus albicereus TaxID=2726185 RepID=A0A6H2GY69_9BACL|nr:LTA synthase family protein [Paenibacillus albicereus]QJC52374.1 sulfatase-like hydrolase/transferase [Paenibacillus albicereus]